MQISAVILTKNEEKNIADCIESLLWCDEILVLDDESTDNTSKIVKKYKVNLIKHRLADFASQRNFALHNVKGEWVFFVDADERVSESLRKEIQDLITHNTGNFHGYFAKRQDVIWGKPLKYGETADVRLLRLAKKNAGKWEGRVHEVWKINGTTSTLQNSLLHFPHPSIREFLEKINYYSDLRVQELYDLGARASAITVIIYPNAKFFVNYFIKLGVLDGIEGIIFALMMSLHSFLVRGKLWLLWKKS